MKTFALATVAVGGRSHTCDVSSHKSYSGTKLQVQRGGSLEDCCAACGTLKACKHYTFHPDDGKNPTACFLQDDDGIEETAHKNFSHGQVPKGKFCDDSFGCSLAGDCQDGVCVCDGWTHGDHCEILNLLPVDEKRFGYRNASGFNSWGGGPVLVDGKWHFFASQMQGKCPLAHHWSSVSEAVHSISDNPLGPFETAEVVIPSLAHNVKPFQHPDGTFLIYYVGQINNQTADCSNGSLADSPQPKGAAGPVMIASASHPDAPAEEWKIHGPMTDSFEWHSATNPSPVFLQNGSVLLYVSRRWAVSPTKNHKNNWVMMADSWRGPYRNVTQTYEDAVDTGEDPHVFKTQRGYHMLNHNMGPAASGLSFSADGVTWTKGHEVNAFNATLQWSNGSVTTLCRRQRPFVVMKDDGMPGWLWNGVMDNPADGDCEGDSEWFTWTLGQEIGRLPQTVLV